MRLGPIGFAAAGWLLAASAPAQEASESAGAGVAAVKEAGDAGDPLPDAEELARRAAAALGGEALQIAARIEIARPGRSTPRTLELELLSDRRSGRALLRVLAPEKQAGRTFLALPPNVWSWKPRRQRTQRVPAAQRGEPWMDSDFTLDDLLGGPGAGAGYEHRLLGGKAQAVGSDATLAWVVEATPREGEERPWSRVVSWIEPEGAVPLRHDYYDRSGELVRTLRFSELREVGGRLYPHRWTMRPAQGRGRETRLLVEAVRLDAALVGEPFATRSVRAEARRAEPPAAPPGPTEGASP